MTMQKRFSLTFWCLPTHTHGMSEQVCVDCRIDLVMRAHVSIFAPSASCGKLSRSRVVQFSRVQSIHPRLSSVHICVCPPMEHVWLVEPIEYANSMDSIYSHAQLFFAHVLRNVYLALEPFGQPEEQHTQKLRRALLSI